MDPLDQPAAQRLNSTSITINGEDKTEELLEFARAIGLETAAPGRFSLLLVTHLYGRLHAGVLNPFKVTDEIRSLEGVGGPSRTKPATEFKYPPLKGLWHKHYVPNGVAALVRNLKNGLAKDGLPWFQERIAEAMPAGEERDMTAEDMKAIVNDAVHLNWQRRSAAAELTGEWIVFARHEGANYYLTLAEHDTGDEIVRRQIDALCINEYPFLATPATS